MTTQISTGTPQVLFAPLVSCDMGAYSKAACSSQREEGRLRGYAILSHDSPISNLVKGISHLYPTMLVNSDC